MSSTPEKATSKKGGSKAEEKTSQSKSSVDQVIELLENMTVLELSLLSKSLQERFGVSAVAPAIQAGPAPASALEQAQEEEKTEFNVVLSQVGDKKIQVIKLVRELTGLGLKEAKELVDTAPKPVKEGIPKEEAMSIKAKFAEVGATCEVK